MNHTRGLLVALSLGAGTCSAATHPFLPDSVTTVIAHARAVYAYQLAVGVQSERSLGYLGGVPILRCQPVLDAEQRGFIRWAASSDQTHDSILEGYACACALPTMGLRFISASDSVDVTLSPECFSTWRFSISRGDDWGHLSQTSTSFAVIRPEMLTLLREIFPGEATLRKGVGAPYRSNWPLQLPGAARNGQ
jgi:hypothetical protein